MTIDEKKEIFIPNPPRNTEIAAEESKDSKDSSGKEARRQAQQEWDSIPLPKARSRKTAKLYKKYG